MTSLDERARAELDRVEAEAMAYGPWYVRVYLPRYLAVMRGTLDRHAPYEDGLGWTDSRRIRGTLAVPGRAGRLRGAGGER
jgi:hypothetical protein